MEAGRDLGMLGEMCEGREGHGKAGRDVGSRRWRVEVVGGM